MAATGFSDIVARARDLVPLIEGGRAFSDEKARLSPEVLSACRDAGLFGLSAPAEVGGAEATLVEIFDVTQVVAAADPSTAWVIVNSQPCARAAAVIDPQHWPDIYRQPLGPYGLSAAPVGRLQPDEAGGFTLSGTWPLMTGVLDAEFAVVFCKLRKDDKTSVCQAIIPTAQLTVNEVWQNAVAMRGTGSHEVTATGLAVPEGLIMLPGAILRIDRPLYRTGAYGVPSAVNSAVPIGILQSAVASAGAVLKDRVSSIFGQAAPNSTAMLELMAEAWLSLEHLRLGVRASLEALWEYAERGEPAPASVRATVAGSPFQAVDVARDLISRLYARSSRAAFFKGHTLERALRDIHAIGYGLDVLRPLHHDTGRVALGLDPQTPGY